MSTEKEAVRRGPAAFPGGELLVSVHHQETSWCLSNLAVFQSLPGEERDRVLAEEKMGGAKLTVGVASSPHRAKSPSVKVQLSSVCSVLGGPRTDFNHQHPVTVGALSGSPAGAMGLSWTVQRQTGRDKDIKASRNAQNSRGDVAAQCDWRLPG